MQRQFKVTALIVFILLSISFALSGMATGGEISAELSAVMAQTAANDTIPVIVHFRNRVRLNDYVPFGKKTRRRLLIRALKQRTQTHRAGVASLLGQTGGRRIRDLWLVNGLAVELRPQIIRALARRTIVDTIRLDQVIPLASPTPSGSGSAAWNLAMIQADTLWARGYTGQGVVVANMDTGVDIQNIALAASWRGGSNSWYDPSGAHAAPFDADGHGTQTMGVMVGGAGLGVAPMARWIAVKIFDDAGFAATSDIHSGYQWLLDPDGNPDTDDAPDIVNNSWGFDTMVDQCNTEFEADIAALRTAEIAVVFAAGNSGPSAYTSLSPANNAGSLAVGAVDDTGTVIPLSSNGPSACSADTYPHLTAPGFSILTTDLTAGGAFPDATAFASGTSFAAPHVAGAMALLRSAVPTVTLVEMEMALQQSTLDIGPIGPDNSSGYGLVQAAEALTLLTGVTSSCTDADGDGFFGPASDPACGAPVDCNDNDATIYPGAAEIPFDGIDQDCNGYDLTIQVVKAEYRAANDAVVVQATSSLGIDAGLTVDLGWLAGPMVWKADLGMWQRWIGGAVSKGFDPAIPGDVIVAGPEGDITAPVDGGIAPPPQCTDTDGDGFFGPASDPACGAPVDCNDNDATIYPGAAEIPFDGIDQDCNGYDLTIQVVKAEYRAANDAVVVQATSSLGIDAGLTVDLGWLAGPMVWKADLGMWQRWIGGAVSKGFDPAIPGDVIVAGPEGDVMLPMTLN